MIHRYAQCVIHANTCQVILVTVVLLCSRQAACGEPPLPKQADEARRSVKKLSNDQLVEGLASKNRQPTVRHAMVDVFPDGYNVGQQQYVTYCFDEIIARGRDAFSVLVDHLEDRRYSCLQGSSIEPYCRTVGNVCHFALYSQVRPWPARLYGPNYRPLIRESAYVIPPASEGATWFETRKDKSLLEMQTEAAHASIEFLRVGKPFLEAPGLRQEYIGGLEWCVRYLDQVGEPISIQVNWESARGGRLPAGEPILPFWAKAKPILDKTVERLVGKPPFRLDQCIPPSLYTNNPGQ